MTAPRQCACGCPNPVTRDHRALYASEACKARAHRQRRRVSRLTAQEMDALNLPPLKPSTYRTLRALLAVGGHGCTTRELCQPDVGGIRVSARIYELREIGLRIDVNQERPGSYRYRLISNAASERLFTPASDAA